MHEYLIDILACPACHGELDWSISQRQAGRILTAEARCRECAATYPVYDGIVLFLTPDLPREDLWKQFDSQLAKVLRQDSDLERRLLSVPPETLNPADQFLRAMVLEERGAFAEAREVEDLANEGLYTSEYRACWESQISYTIARLSAMEGPIIDLASGRGYLVERITRELEHPVVATDFSPGVLQQDRRRLEAAGLYDRVSLLACDARRMPFRPRAIPTLTTNIGLPNIQDPGTLIAELHRVVGGSFLAVTHFFPEDDATNAAQIRDLGLETFLFRRSALEGFSQAGWEVQVINSCQARAQPTPPSAIFEGARIDSLPAAATTLEWCVLEAVPV